MSVSHRGLLVVVGVLVAAAGAGLVLLRPPAGALEEVGVGRATDAQEIVDATITDVTERPAEPGMALSPDAVTVDLVVRLDGSGEIVAFSTVDELGGLYEAGQAVRLGRAEGADGQDVWFVVDLRRGAALVVLTALFVIVVLVFGRWQGLRALLGLTLSGAVVVGFVVPAVLAGRSPVPVALVGSVLVMVLTLYLSHGLAAKTTAAVVGTAGALAFTAALAALFVDAVSLTGLASEEARAVAVTVGGLSLEGLLLAGIIIGGLGVLDDVTISQASTVFELRRALPDASAARLSAGALRVGRDHIAATINTLVLAYVGAALPVLVLFSLSGQPAGIVVSSEIVAVEIVRALVGSIGLMAAVPLTTLIAAALAVGQRDVDGPADAEEEAWLEWLRDA